MFFYGEDRVADTLAPYITAAPTEEQSYFLATQQVDEVRHSIFFHRFFKEVIGVGGDSIQSTLASTLPQLNWGYRGIFDRLDVMAEELRKDRSLPKYAQAITLYHLIVEGSLAQPGQHFIEDFFASEETMPGFSSRAWPTSPATSSATSASASRSSPSCWPRARPARRRTAPPWSSCCAKSCPTAPPSSTPPNMDREYTECYGFSLEDIYAFGLKLIRQRWRTIGYPTEEMPPGVFPFDPDASEREIAENQVKLMMAGILGPPDGPSAGRLAGDAAPLLRRDQPRRRPEGRQRLAAGLPVALHRRRPLAPDHRQRLDPGRAGRGAADPTLVLEASWSDFVATGKPDANPLKMLLQRRMRPRGSIREIARLRKVFPS